MRHLDLFSGIGGFALASTWVWGDEYENVGHSEIEPYACKVYHKHFPESKCLGDITKIQWQEGQADLITGGFPCQPHSLAGKRKASADSRDLWGECARAVRLVRPHWALFENVPGLLVSERGAFFNRVLTDLAEAGYDAEWYTIGAWEVGAPHKRDRVWIIAHNRKDVDDPTENTVRCGRPHIGHEIPGNIGNEWDTSTGIGTGLRREGEEITNPDNKWLRRYQGRSGKNEPARSSWDEDWYEVATRLCRMDDGIPYRVDRFKGLGNAIVPQVAQVILRAIKDSDTNGFVESDTIHGPK